jgi:hypothetical protein
MKLDTRTVPRGLAALAATLCVVSAPVLAQGPSQPASQASVQKPAQGTPGRVASRPMPRPNATAPGKPLNSTSRFDVRRPPGVRMPRPTGGTGAIGSRSTSIQGAAWRSDNTPVPKAVLRLRNVITGKVEATTIANDAGNFAFTGIGDGTYLIEMVSESGKVMMVGHTFTVAPGETVATFVRLGPKVPWFNGFFGNAAQTVSSSAASTGVQAIAPEVVTCISACVP